MSPERMDGVIYGVLLTAVAVVSIVITLAELRRKGPARDPQIISMSGGFALFCAFFAVVLLTGLVDLLPVPR